MKEIICPHCGSRNVGEPYKEYEMKGRDFSNPQRYNTIIVRLYRCKDCNKAFRKGEPQK